MSLFLVSPSTLASPSTTLLLIDGLVLGFHVTAAVAVISLKNLLPPRFLAPSLTISACLFTGCLIATLFLINISFSCQFSRKLGYSFTYIGYLTYDTYQIYDVIRVTTANIYVKVILFTVLAGRVASLGYNLATVEGAISVVATTGNYIGAGPCKTIQSPEEIHQEHAVAMFLETLVLIIVVLHARKLSNDNVSWKKIVTKVFNFEILSFFFYLLIEVVYIIVYQLIPPGYVSYLNVWYSQVPGVLFFANCLNFAAERRRKMILSLKGDVETSQATSDGKLDDWIKKDSEHTESRAAGTKSATYIDAPKLIRNTSVLEHSRSVSNTPKIQDNSNTPKVQDSNFSTP